MRRSNAWRVRPAHSIPLAFAGLIAALLSAWMAFAFFNELILVPGDPSRSPEHNLNVKLVFLLYFASLSLLFAAIARWAYKKRNSKRGASN
jgi:hypothetical protein